MSKASFENQRVIQPPATLTLQVKDMDNYNRDLLLKFSKNLKRIISKLRELTGHAKVDLTVLSNLIYKNHNRFRNDKGFRDLKLVKKTALRMFDEVKLDDVMDELAANMPVPYDLRTAGCMYLPVRQMAEHVMVRLHGCARLLLVLVQHCEHAAAKAKQKMRLGHFWNVALYSSACVSRLWALSLSTLSAVLEAYEEHFKVHSCLPKHSSNWLPDDYQLPKSLLADICSSEEQLTVISKKMEDCCVGIVNARQESKTSRTQPEVIVAEEDSKQPDLGVVVERPDIQLANEDKTNQQFREILLCDNDLNQSDLGVIVERPEVSQGKDISAKRWRKMVQCVGQTTSSPELLAKFAADESSHRKRDRKSALTKNLSQEQWKEMRTQIKDTLAESSATSKKAQLESAQKLILYWLADPKFKGLKPDCWKKYEKYIANQS